MEKMYRRGEATKIRAEYKTGDYTYEDLAKMHNLSRSTIANIICGYRYKKKRRRKPKN